MDRLPLICLTCTRSSRWCGGGAAALGASRGRRAAAVFIALYLLSTAVQHL
ncbi:hypothetical protein [Planotetraspora kaengkrachanensis]|uniref:hypothetical protein n=1 Tax=Planotetraspora kaengkrachanensis TaxID=575193 RepID=UPI0019432EDD|nr:hypothetical protein [Planotetraspora kaengkrachanensis]